MLISNKEKSNSDSDDNFSDVKESLENSKLNAPIKEQNNIMIPLKKIHRNSISFVPVPRQILSEVSLLKYSPRDNIKDNQDTKNQSIPKLNIKGRNSIIDNTINLSEKISTANLIETENTLTTKNNCQAKNNPANSLSPHKGHARTPCLEKINTKKSVKHHFDFETLCLQQELIAGKTPIWTSSFSCDGKYFATAGEDGEIRIWVVTNFEEQCNF